MKNSIILLLLLLIPYSLFSQKLELIKDFNTNAIEEISENVYNISTTSNSGYLYFVTSNEQYSLINRTKNGNNAELISLDIPLNYVVEIKAIQSKVYILTLENLFIYDEILDSLYEFSTILPTNNNFERIYPSGVSSKTLNHCLYTDSGVIILSKKLNSYDLQLWKTDGTSPGTSLLKTLPSFLYNGDYLGMMKFNDILFLQFNALYLYDLSSNSYTSKNVQIIKPLLKNNQFFFLGKDINYGDELWKTDGTVSGTEMVYDIYPGDIGSQIENIQIVDSIFFFNARHPNFGYEPWISNGSASGTRVLKDFTSGNNLGNSQNFNIVKCRNKFYFTLDDTIYKADLSLHSNTIVKLFIQGIGTSPKHLFVMNDTVYFSLYKNNIGRKFYKYTGINPVIQVTDLNPTGNDVLEDSPIYLLDNTWIFRYNNNVFAKSNGTIQGSKFIIKPNKVNYSTNILDFAIHQNNLLCFVRGSYNSVGGRVLMLKINAASDTAQMINHWALTTSSISTFKYIKILHNNLLINSEFYFSYNLVSKESQLWHYNFNGDKTKLIANPLEYINGPTSFSNFFVVNNNCYFVVNRKLYTSNGKKNNVVLLKEEIYDDVENSLYFNNELYFKFRDDVYKTNGTQQGTVKAFDFGVNINIQDLEMVQFDTSIALLVKHSGVRNLYLSNGTQQGTHLVKSFVENQNSNSYVSDLFVYNNFILFKLSTNNSKTELWKSDGTSMGTVLLKSLDMNSSNVSLSPTIFKGKFYFNGKIINSSIPYTTIIVSDGTTTGTVPFVKISNLNQDIPCSNFTVVGDKMFFVADVNNNKQLYYTNGISTTIVIDINSNPTIQPEYSSFISYDNKLFFVGYQDNKGAELWRSNGTALGTRLIKEFIPGPSSGVNSGFVMFDSKLYFRAYDPKLGYELWSINKNEELKLECDIAKGILSSNVANINALNDSTLIFTANHAKYSNELFSFNPHKLDAEIISERTCSDPEFKFSVQLNTTSDSIINYQWDFGNGETSSLSEPILVSQADTINCNVKVECVSGRFDTLYYTYINHHKIEINLHINNKNQCLVTNNFKFTDKSIRSDSVISYSRKWDLGDGTIITNDSIIEHNYKSVGAYTVKLELTDNRGCITSVSDVIKVNKNMSSAFLGKDSVLGDSTYAYYLPHSSGNSYLWTVIDGDGIIVGNNNINEVKIKWKPVNDNSIIRLNTTDSNNCSIVLYKTVNISNVVGVKLDKDNSELQIIPNPSDEFIYIKSKSNVSTYKIYDQTGRLILDNVYSPGMIDVSILSPGIYILKVELEGNRYHFEKLIVK